LVHDGNSALAAFTAAAQQVLPFDAVVVNLGLPDMDGAKVIARLRAQQPSLPVLVASGSIRASGNGAPIRVRDSRLTAVVSKPFNPTLLAATFADLISEAERDRA
jgi:CheY-like chemotaxis protein